METVSVKGGEIPLVGYGTYPLAGDAAVAGVTAALEHGYRHIDTAQMYGNEAEVGRAITRSGLPRDSIFVTTKVHPDNYAPGRFRDSVRASLDSLGLDRVDLLLLHWPNPRHRLAEVLDLLVEAQEAGQTRLIGISNNGPGDIVRAVELSGGRVVNDQIEFHPLLDRSGEQEAARRAEISLTAYCPVARGRVADEPELQAIGARHGKTAAQVALRWAVQQGVIVIPKASTPARIGENLALFDFALDEHEMRRISALRSRNRRLIQFAGYTAWQDS